MKKATIIFICSIIMIGCETNSSIDYYKKYLLGSNYYRLDEYNSKLVIFESCAASVPSFKFYTDSLYQNWGQESYYLYIKKIDFKNNIMSIKASYSKKEKSFEEVIFLLDTVNKTVKYNNQIYIDSLYSNKYEYVKEPCINCWDKETCNKLALEEKERKERPLYIKNWQGVYSFNYHIIHMGEEFKGIVKFYLKETLYVLFDEDKESLEIVKATKDTLKLQNSNGDIYKINKDEQGNFSVSGNNIYMLNPPNESYLLTKEK